MYQNLAILGGFVFLYSVSSKALERTPINGAVVFTAFGLLVGPLGLDLLKLDVTAEEIRFFAELTLALVLFTDAANANLRILERNVRFPVRLLLIGLPLTILLGFGLGVLLFGSLTLCEVAILATLLAPTDAALGKAVVTDKSVPAKIREALNVESGLNDGICVPILFVFLALATGSNGDESTPVLALKLVAEEIGIGVAVGAVLTLAGTWLIKVFGARGWISETWEQLPVVALAVACLCVAQILGGSGFIASFVGGLLFGGLTHHRKHKHALLLAAEGTGDTLALVTWVVFGSAVISQSIGEFSWQVVLYAVLSLTVVRMVPVVFSLAGLRLSMSEKLFVGWFGPRGMASIVFAVIVLNEGLPGSNMIVITAVCTIMLSVVAHGLSANPLVSALAARVHHASKAPDSA